MMFFESTSSSSSSSSTTSSNGRSSTSSSWKLFGNFDFSKRQNDIHDINPNPVLSSGAEQQNGEEHVPYDYHCENGTTPTFSLPKQQQQPQQRQQQDEDEEEELDNSYVDGLLSSKLTKMSLEERSDGLHDIHGISQVQETLEMIQNGIDDMNQTLIDTVLKEIEQEKKSNRDGDSNNAATRRQLTAFYYRLAMMKSPSYVEQLKVSFLRAEEYDGSKAAMRMIRFFQLKAELFGEDSLVRDLEFERDLGEEGQDAMNCGLFQILPQRDRAGRPIVFAYGKVNSSKYSTDTIMRCIFYTAMCPALQDIESQKRGVVVVSYTLGQRETVSGRPSAIVRCGHSIPGRISAYHLCMNTSALSIPAYLLCSYLENRSICRFKVHTGTPVECVYNLMTYGIPKDVLPVDVIDGSVDLTPHHVMLGKLKRFEELHRRRESRKTSAHPHTQQQQQHKQFSLGDSLSDISASMSLPHHHEPSIMKLPASTATAGARTVPSSLNEQSTCDFSLDVIQDGRGRGDDSKVQSSTLSDCSTDALVETPGVMKVATCRKSTSSSRDIHTEMATAPCSNSNDSCSSTAPPENNLIFVPGPMDIITGKGRKPRRLPGGLRLHNLILKYQEQYDDSTKGGKAKLMDVVLKELKEAGCRFLTVAPEFEDTNSSDNNDIDKNNKYQEGKEVFVECDSTVAKKKISHAFRNLRFHKKQQPDCDPDYNKSNTDVITNNNSNAGQKMDGSINTSSSGGGSIRPADTISDDCVMDHTGAKKRLRTEGKKCLS